MHGNKKNNFVAILKNLLFLVFFFLKNIWAGLDSLNADLIYCSYACKNIVKVYQGINDTWHVHEVHDVRKLSGLSYR